MSDTITPNLKPEEHSFRVAIVGQNVDVDKRKIKDVIIADSTVNDKDYRSKYIDDDFLTELVKIAPDKVPVEADHNYGTSFGKKLGYIDNIRLVGTQVKGDLHIYKSADESPLLPNAGKYLMAQIKEDPKSYSLSMKISSARDWENDILIPTKLKGVDVVGNGAVTNSMFKAQPEAQPEANQRGNFFQKLINKYFKPMANTPPEVTPEELAFDAKMQEQAQKLEDLKGRFSALEQNMATKDAEITALQAKVSTKDAEITALQAKVTELEKAPAEESAKGGDAVQEPTPKQEYSAYTLQAMKRFGKNPDTKLN